MIKELRAKFPIKELVCPHCFARYKEAQLWSFFDTRLLATLYVVRFIIIKKAMVVNNSSFTQRGLRCNICDLVLSKSKTSSVYMTAHFRGQGIDFHVPGMTPEETRQVIIKNQELLPFPIRIEQDVNWVHIDVCSTSDYSKIQLFKA